MPDTTASSSPPAATSAAEWLSGGGLTPAQLALKRRYPTSLDLRDRARRRLPHFAFAYLDGGAGAGTGIDRNWNAFDSIELVPRYGRVVPPPPTGTTLFGRSYAAPIGISPIGGPGTAFPGAETYFAQAAQAARIPYTLGVLSAITIEQAAALAPDVLWLQLYRFPRDGHRIGMDLMRRADAAGVQALVLTWDTPVRTTRPRETRSGIMTPFRLTNRLRLDALRSPAWLISMLRNGIPRFVSLYPYMDGKTGFADAADFMRRESGGAFTWDEVARYREAWKGPLLLKGILHPADAERAVALGVDGLHVSNHGGRQIEALPASIDALPAIAEQVAGRATVILDKRGTVRRRRRPGGRPGRGRRLRWQGLPLEPGCAGRAGTRPSDQPADGGAERDPGTARLRHLGGVAGRHGSA